MRLPSVTEKPFPAFDLYPNDFLGSFKVSRMDGTEIGVYFMLLLLDWQENGFEFERQGLADWCRIRPQVFDRCWKKVSKCFTIREGRMYNPRLEIERQKKREWRRKSREGGKASGQARFNGGSTVVSPLVEAPSPTPSPSPLKTTTTGAAPVVKTLSEVGKFYATLKPYLFGSDPEPSRDLQMRDVSCLKRLRLHWPDPDILLAAQELRRQVDNGQTTGWVAPRKRFGCQALYSKDEQSGVWVMDRMLGEARRREQNEKHPAGLKALSDAMRKAGVA